MQTEWFWLTVHSSITTYWFGVFNSKKITTTAVWARRREQQQQRRRINANRLFCTFCNLVWSLSSSSHIILLSFASAFFITTVSSFITIYHRALFLPIHYAEFSRLFGLTFLRWYIYFDGPLKCTCKRFSFAHKHPLEQINTIESTNKTTLDFTEKFSLENDKS